MKNKASDKSALLSNIEPSTTVLKHSLAGMFSVESSNNEAADGIVGLNVWTVNIGMSKSQEG